MKHALIILAPGFEETEAVTVIDLLRRADCAACGRNYTGFGSDQLSIRRKNIHECPL